jgi:hypothetical protein
MRCVYVKHDFLGNQGQLIAIVDVHQQLWTCLDELRTFEAQVKLPFTSSGP